MAVNLLVMKGYAYDPVTKAVFVEEGKYLHNFLDMPLVLVVFLAGVLLLLAGIYVTLFKESRKGIWFSGLGAVLIGIIVFTLAGFNGTAFYPSYTDLQSSLTIQNTSGSENTLWVMAGVSVAVPIVLGYIAYVWYQMKKEGPITKEEILTDEHAY